MQIKMNRCDHKRKEFWRQLWKMEGCNTLLRDIDFGWLKFETLWNGKEYELEREGDTVTTDCSDIGAVLQALVVSRIATEEECTNAIIDNK